jgi:hypothetical protein
LEQGRVVEITHRMTTELLPETQTTSKTLSLQ